MSSFTQKSRERRGGNPADPPSSLKTDSRATLQQANDPSRTTAQLSAQERLNLSPKVRSQIQMQQLLDGSPRVTTQAKLAESMNRRGDAPLPQQAVQLLESEGAESAASGELAPPVQLKRDIVGSHDYAQKGTLEINMEERYRGSAGGEYGIIRFTPDKEDGTDADKIDLVQIASMTTNKRGQAAANEEEIDENVEEEHSETSGTPAVKDLWRIDTPERFHIDLTGDALNPRATSDDDRVEDAYNAERRGGGWEDPINEVTMGHAGRAILDNYHAKGAPDTDTFTISQDPGYRHGEDVRPAEMHDFPAGPDAAVFSFHTTVDADGDSWGTVKWGFTTVKNREDQTVVDTTQGPTFVGGETEEMYQARLQFDNMMANPGSWTSPETLENAKGLLNSRVKGEQTEGRRYLDKIAENLLWVFTRIDETTDEAVFKRFTGPHLDTADQVLNLMYANGKSREDLYRKLSAAYLELTDRWRTR